MSRTDIHIALSLDGKKLKIQPHKPVLFLAGPIRNAPKWHQEAIRIAIDADTETFVAAPIRSVPDDIRPYVLTDTSSEVFERQRMWELYYLSEAINDGCIIFWLPKEADIKEFQDKIYAHITMMELGTALAAKRIYGKDFNLVIGTDGEFPEWKTVLIDIELTEGIPICYTLEDTISTALKLIYG